MKIALCPGGMMDVAQWLIDEAKAAGYEIEVWLHDHGDLSTVQALFCLAEQGDGRAEGLQALAREALARGLPVIWAVDGVEFPGAFRAFTDFSKIPDAAPLLEAVLALPKPAEKEEAPKRRLAIPNPTKLLQRPVAPEPEPQPSPVETLPTTLDRVIAVGGPRGCGSSFVAWNLAVALDAVLMEGRTTDSLAAWLGVEAENTREAYLRGELQTKAAVTASRPLGPDELSLLARVQERVVVDVGDALDSEVWRRAGKRVLVLAPDPKCRGMEITERCLRVMNRYPDAFPVRPEKLLQTQIDLVIPDLGREAFLSLWSRTAWVQRHPEVRDQWRRLFDRESADDQQQQEVVSAAWQSWS